MNTVMNLELVKLSHFNWITKIESFVEGQKIPKNEVAISHLDSELGKWYYAVEQNKYKHLKEVQFLELKYKKLHTIAQYIWESKMAGDFELVKIYYADFLEVTKRIIKYFEIVEEIIFEKTARMRVVNF
ncbi:CZB domain-containing protein [Flavobacterium sp.]|uniref:CZB domain-containing protein n=1 Tax=Flavobacterium sp. TaxID=239 RepID=UPI00286E9358|nr:CZB domain-containing protein [Flavobacterium sp.]